MGTFSGHALPGSYLILYGFWWTIMAVTRYSQSKGRGSHYKSSASFTMTCCCGRYGSVPLEAISKVVLFSVAVIVEIIYGFENGRFVRLGDAQHATMFSVFIISGIIDLLTFLKCPLPPGTDYVTLAMAFGIEGLLFQFHLHGRSQLNVLLHTFLLYSIYATVVVIIVEIRHRHSILFPLTRAYFLLLQGTWFWQIGFILYNPIPDSVDWKPDDHDEMTVATLLFAWHAIVDFILIIVLTFVIQCCFFRIGKEHRIAISFNQLHNPGTNGSTFVSFQGDSQSDQEE